VRVREKQPRRGTRKRIRSFAITFVIVALICRLGQAPYECVPQTARDVMTIGEASSPMDCMMRSQQSLARVSLARRLAPDEWTKIVCERKN
jgi:hypothetical protein